MLITRLHGCISRPGYFSESKNARRLQHQTKGLLAQQHFSSQPQMAKNRARTKLLSAETSQFLRMSSFGNIHLLSQDIQGLLVFCSFISIRGTCLGETGAAVEPSLSPEGAYKLLPDLVQNSSQTQKKLHENSLAPEMHRRCRPMDTAAAPFLKVTLTTERLSSLC